jgi:hypothetical protein
MATIALSAPLTLNPDTAINIKLISSTNDYAGGFILITFDLCDANWRVLETRSNVKVSGPAIATYVAAEGVKIGNRLLTKLNATGTVA